MYITLPIARQEKKRLESKIVFNRALSFSFYSVEEGDLITYSFQTFVKKIVKQVLFSYHFNMFWQFLGCLTKYVRCDCDNSSYLSVVCSFGTKVRYTTNKLIDW